MKVGSIVREGKGRVVTMTIDNSRRLLIVHGIDSMIESFLFLPEEEAKVKAKKRTNKENKKLLG